MDEYFWWIKQQYPVENIMWSVMGKQTAQTRKVYWNVI